MPVSTECAAALLSFRYPSLNLDSLPICKGKPYLKLSKLILNWTVHEN